MFKKTKPTKQTKKTMKKTRTYQKRFSTTKGIKKETIQVGGVEMQYSQDPHPQGSDPQRKGSSQLQRFS